VPAPRRPATVVAVAAATGPDAVWLGTCLGRPKPTPRPDRPPPPSDASLQSGLWRPRQPTETTVGLRVWTSVPTKGRSVRWHALVGREMWVQREWFTDPERMRHAGFPGHHAFAVKGRSPGTRPNAPSAAGSRRGGLPASLPGLRANLPRISADLYSHALRKKPCSSGAEDQGTVMATLPRAWCPSMWATAVAVWSNG
jgi:hypothetical protein